MKNYSYGTHEYYAQEIKIAEERLSLIEQAINERIERVAKNLKIEAGKSSYKAVSEADVLAAVKPVEVKYGVYSYPLTREVIKDEMYTTVSEYNGNKTERNSFFMRVKTVYRFVNVDNPAEFIDITTYVVMSIEKITLCVWCEPPRIRLYRQDTDGLFYDVTECNFCSFCGKQLR